ncbi:unnamed protein product [Linum trigynum]|uniref:Uncharacterized protein n=1 Tax=Linum trigynum TaxID=586398 RepID=A0AAV2D5N6_9ROSI
MHHRVHHRFALRRQDLHRRHRDHSSRSIQQRISHDSRNPRPRRGRGGDLLCRSQGGNKVREREERGNGPDLKAARPDHRVEDVPRRCSPPSQRRVLFYGTGASTG